MTACNRLVRGRQLAAWPVSRWLLGLVLCTVLAACAPPDPGVSKRELVNTPLEGCCDNAEFYPPPLVHMADPLAPVIGRLIGGVVMRKGHIARPRAREEVATRLRPLDVLFVSSNGRLSGTLLPGVFSHAVIYFGSEAELTALGVWDDPALASHRAAIRAGKTFIESNSPGVHLSDAETVLNTDAVAVLRPPIHTRARRRAALRDLAGHLGRDFDFHFDSASTEEFYCAELAARTMPETGMPTRRIYGRQTILPDDVVALAATGRGDMELVTYLRGTRAGWRRLDRATLVADMNDHWRALRRSPGRAEARNRR